jgi:O-antigen ligase
MKNINQTATNFLPYCFLLMLLGILVSPSFKALNNIFYVTFIPLTLLAFREYFSTTIRCPIFLWLMAFASWMALSSTWAQTPEYKDLKAICYVIVFIIGVSLIDETSALKKWGYIIPPAIILQLCLGDGLINSRLSGYGPTEHPLYAGQFYLFFTWLFLNYKEFHAKPNISEIIRWSGFLLSLGACCMTQSRSVIACLPLLLLTPFFLNILRVHLIKTLAVLILTLSLAGIYAFNNQWITLPSHIVDYQIDLDKGESLTVKFLKPRESTPPPTIIKNSVPLEGMHLDPRKETFSFTAKERGVYDLKVKLAKATYFPWLSVATYTQEHNKKRKPSPAFSLPRAFSYSSSLNGRTTIWRARFSQWMEKPFLGYGFSHQMPVPFHSDHVNDSHNFFLGTAFNGGLTALVIYLGLLTASFYRLSPGKYRPLLLLLICGIITTSFDDENFFSSVKPHWFLLLFPLGKALKIELNQKKLSPSDQEPTTNNT